MRIIISAFIIFISNTVFAQAKPMTAADYSAAIATELLGQCPALIVGIVDAKDSDVALALKNRPTDVKSVCACATDKVRSDARLPSIVIADQKPRTREQVSHAVNQVSGYISLLFLRSTMSCLAEDLEQSMKVSPLPQ
jgi:hypothetical protein